MGHRLHHWIQTLRERLRGIVQRLHPLRVLRTGRWLARLVRRILRRRRISELTVAVDISPLYEPLTGVGWYLYQVIRHLSDRDDVRLHLYGPQLVPTADLPGPSVTIPRGRALEHVVYQVSDDLLIPAHLMVRALRCLEPLLIAADGNDIVFAPNYFPPRRLALARGGLVITVHDLAFRHHGWTLRKATAREFQRHLDSALFRASRIITVSEAVRSELASHEMPALTRIRAIHHGPGQLATAEAGERPEEADTPYGLFVGTLEPRKNITTLVEAWRKLCAERFDAPRLLLCGSTGWKSGPIRAAVRAAEADGVVSHLGYVSEEALVTLYRDARCVVCPSLYEGFGLPLVEAMLAGTPLVCSDIPVFREVAADAALYAAPRDTSAWKRAVGKLLDDPRLAESLVERGYARVARFNWSHSATAHLEVFSRAAS